MTHADYHFSIKCFTNHLAVLHCLRGLAQYAEKSQLKGIAWGGTDEEYWQSNDHCVVFHFSQARYRQEFKEAAAQFLIKDCWTPRGCNDADPASPEKPKAARGFAF